MLLVSLTLHKISQTLVCNLLGLMLLVKLIRKLKAIKILVCSSVGVKEQVVLFAPPRPAEKEMTSQAAVTVLTGQGFFRGLRAEAHRDRRKSIYAWKLPTDGFNHHQL